MNRNSKKHISEIAEINSEDQKSSGIESSIIQTDAKSIERRKNKCKFKFNLEISITLIYEIKH